MDIDSGTKDLFSSAVSKPDNDINLCEAALLLAAERYPGLPVREYMEFLSKLGEALEWKLEGAEAPEHKICRLNQFLFSELGFEGNDEDYYDPRNNFLNEVLDSHIGSPTALSILMVDLGQRVGLPIHGVKLPLHFIVKYIDDGREILMDPFDWGGILRIEDCAEILARLSRGRVVLRRSHLEKCKKRDILVRLLNNLKRSYHREHDYESCLWAIGRLLILKPDSPQDIRDRGIVHFYLGQYEKARMDLERYLECAPDAPDAEQIEQNITRVIKRFQQLN